MRRPTDIGGSDGLDKRPRTMQVVHSYPSSSRQWLASGTDNDDDDDFENYFV